MVHSEIDVINKIRDGKDSDGTMQIAIKVILDYLVQKGSSQSQSADQPPEPYAVT